MQWIRPLLLSCAACCFFTGQTKPIVKSKFGSEHYQDSYLAYMLGRSIVGMRAEDILNCARYAAERFAGGRVGTVELIAVGNVGVPALHAAALEPELFQAVNLLRTLVSWSNVIHSRLSKGQVVNLVHGALTHYDLPNLAAVLGEKLSVEEPLDAMGELIQPKHGRNWPRRVLSTSSAITPTERLPAPQSAG